MDLLNEVSGKEAGIKMQFISPLIKLQYFFILNIYLHIKHKLQSPGIYLIDIPGNKKKIGVKHNINLTKMLTINKAIFYLNKKHIESLSSNWEFHGGIYDKSVVCTV